MMPGLYGAGTSREQKALFQGPETEPGPITCREKGPRKAAFQEQREAQPPSQIS